MSNEEWVLKQNIDPNGVIKQGVAIAVSSNKSPYYEIAAVWKDAPGWESNAHLIAAAPELYEALNKASEALWHNGVNKLARECDNALAKARGE